MNNEFLNNLWPYSVLMAVILWAFLILRLVFGVIKKKTDIVKSTIKYLINTLLFLFDAYVYFSFFIVVQAPIGETRDDSIRMLNQWVKDDSLEWLYWGMAITLILAIFNYLYQIKIERIKSVSLIIILAILDLLIILYGIFLGSYTAIQGLTEEINRHTF